MISSYFFTYKTEDLSLMIINYISNLPSVRVFAYLSVLRGPSSVLGEGHRTASEFKPDFIEARTKLVEVRSGDNIDFIFL